MSFKPGYIGGKASAGVFHTIIGEMPPHSFYLEPFFGSGAVFYNKRAAERSILIDRDATVITRIDATTGIDARHGDALQIVPTLMLPADAVAYFDPPYPLGTRKGRSYYKNEVTDEDHERLIAMILGLPYRVLISSYPNKLYVDQLRNWRCCRFPGVTRGGPKTEMLWCNFDPPTELHDWRFAGRTFRERLTFRRLASRTVARLEAMPPRKRGYVLNAIADLTGRANAAASAGTAPQFGNPQSLPASQPSLPDPNVQTDAARSITPNLVLSLFPGIDLLGRGFEAEGYNVVRGPDKLFGQDIRGYIPARCYEGMIGGSPCQKFSKANRSGQSDDEGLELVAQFSRCVTLGQPIWFLLENVPGVPDLQIEGYKIQRFNLNASECGLTQNRLRAFQFGCRDRSVLVIPRSNKPHVVSRCAMASEAYRNDARTWPEFCALQGLPPDFELPGWSKGARYRMVGNGVPIPMARIIAAAIRSRLVTGTVRLCICQCGREVPTGRTMATDACRQRMKRRRDAAGVTPPGIVTSGLSQGALAFA